MAEKSKREIIKKKMTADLVLRSYSKDDDEACESLELRANQFKNQKLRTTPIVGPLIGMFQDSLQVHMVSPLGADARAKTAEEYEIIVAEVTSGSVPRLVAVVMVNIRPVLWSGTRIKVGWVYGLRVHEDYQRRGIGMVLSAELERRCLERDVSMLHLSVNLDNEKAFSLYDSLGYRHASDRGPVTKFLNKGSKVSGDFLVLRVPQEAAVKLLALNYETVDLSPLSKDGFEKLVSSSDYETTFVAVERSDLSKDILQLEQQSGDNNDRLVEAVERAIQSGECKSYGGVAIWNGSAVKKFKVVRLLFHKETWLSLPFQMSLFCALFGGMVSWWLKFMRRMVLAASWLGLVASTAGEEAHGNDTWGFLSLSLLLVEMILVVIASVMASKLVMFFRFVVSRNLSHLSARGSAPFSNGPTGIDCLRNAISSSQNYSRAQGYGLWIMNVDKEHPDSSAFSKSKMKTKFLQKWLKDPPIMGVATGDGTWQAFSPGAFCDPRDM